MKINLKSERGATGTDIILAGAMILVTIVVVSMIFVNTTLSTREVTRTSAATRIATNILGNIDEMTYEAFDSAYTSATGSATLIEDTNNTYYGYYTLSGTTSGITIFETKITQGYTVYFLAENSYGSASEATNLNYQFDLVKEFEVVVEYSVGDTTDTVELSTVKSRELIDEVNQPDTELLTVESGYAICPIKYVEDDTRTDGGYYTYLSTTDTNLVWYDYTSGEWARVIKYKNDPDNSDYYKNYFNESDSNSLYTTSELATISSDYDYTIWVWVPRYTTLSNDFQAFAYSNTSYLIQSLTLTSNSNASYPENYVTMYTYNCTTAVPTTTTGTVDESYGFGTNTGKWVLASDIEDNIFSKKLNAKYAYQDHSY